MNPASPRALPSVDKVLQQLGDQHLPRPWVVHLVRSAIQSLRDQGKGIADTATFVRDLQGQITDIERTRILPVVNGTGILIHTNLGRIPISRAALERAVETASRYNNLEYDLKQGRRGERASYLESLLAFLTEAEAATVVNNGASALVLILRLFTANTSKREVLISRGELIEIGGGFRIPEILEASGARLREVGSTNKTTLNDYARAIGPDTALILKVHKSNFYMEGFVAEPSLAELASLSQDRQIPLVQDLGSGALVDTLELGLTEHELTPNEVLKGGADLVCFSGDKLFGGPQAGIIVGKKSFIRALKKEPFFRTLRCDKVILTLLEECAQMCLHARTRHELPDLPIFPMMMATQEKLTARGEAIGAQLDDLPLTWTLERSEAKVGGGTMPRALIPSTALTLQPRDIPLETLSYRLRTRPLPIVGYISDDFFKLDLRTIFDEQDPAVVAALREVVMGTESSTKS